MIHLFLTGLLMGAADLVPGVSGGTIAFIMGVYEELIDSIRSVSTLKKLLPLFAGMAISLLSLARLIHFLLNGEATRQLLFALFFGFVSGSIFFLAKEVKRWRPNEGVSLGTAALIAYWIAALPALEGAPINAPYLIFSGMIAISAMLLPGISGSFLLHLLGVYTLAIQSLAEWNLFVLGNLSIGVCMGALGFSHVIHYLLGHHRELTLAALIGFMIGSLRSISPFSGAGIGVWIALVAGFALIVLLERKADVMKRQAVGRSGHAGEPSIPSR